MSRPTRLQERIESIGWAFAYVVIAIAVGVSFYGAFVGGWG